MGMSLPTWLTTPGPVLLRNFVKDGKNDKLVEKVFLTEANPLYAKVKFPEGREGNVSIRDLAPCPVGDDDVFVSDKSSGRGEGTNSFAENSSFQNVSPDAAPLPHLLVEGGGPRTPAPREGGPRTLQTEAVEGGGREHGRGNVNPPVVFEAANPNTNTRPPRQSLRSNRGVPPPRYGSNTCSFIWEG